MKVGDRVELTTDVERFPFFIARKGSVGTVIDINERDASVRMDEKLEGCEEWENCVIWSDHFRADFAAEVKPLVHAAPTYKTWVCSKCGQEVLDTQRPEPMKWSDGHVCHFREEAE